MALWKQLLTVTAITLLAIASWHYYPTLANIAGEQADRAESASDSNTANTGQRRGGARSRSRPAASVVTATVQEEEAGSRLVAIGTTRAARSVTLHSQTSGLVAEIAFSAGDLVSEGDVLLRLDDSEEQLAVEQARLDLGAAEDTVARYERLTQSQSIPAVQAEEARTTLARARNQLAAAELALERRRIRAPFSGVMGFAEVDVGDMLGNTTPIATVDDRSTLTVEFSVPERFAAQIAREAAIDATTAAFGQEVFHGEIVATDSRIDPQSRTLRVRAALANEDDRLRPGMAFSVAIEFDTPGRPAVPKIAVQWDREGAYVWKVVDGQAARTPVRVVTRTASAVLVEGDIAPQDVVVAEGADRLREGASIPDSATASAESTGEAG
jgi:RND family efflux transporter MFP subunit